MIAPIDPDGKPEKWPIEILTHSEALGLLATMDRYRPTPCRNRALLAILWRSGLRVSECLALKPSDLDEQLGTVRVLHGKGDKARTVGMDGSAFDLVSRWLDRRARLGVNGHAPLFCTIHQPVGRALTTAYVRQLLRRLAKKAGITKRVHPHGLRHTHAAELAREGVPLPVIQAQLGHASASTTAAYIAHLAPGEVIQAMRKRKW